MTAGEDCPTEELLIYLRMLAPKPRPHQFLDVRWATQQGGMRQRFVSARGIEDAARLIRSLTSRTDVYVGVALRDSRGSGGKSAISGSHLLYIECDHEHAERRIGEFAHPPTMELGSGTPGHRHVYWQLKRRTGTVDVESANRRLALALDGDPASVDIARVLRPPGTLNHKHDPPRAVRLLANRRVRYSPAALMSGLPADARPRRVARSGPAAHRTGRTRLDHELLAIPAARYVRVLTGRSPNLAGKVLCPFHEDTEPSLQLYSDGTFYCFGSGCRRGGTIIDFAAATWGLGTRGTEFLQLRHRLALTFGVAAQSDKRV